MGVAEGRTKRGERRPEGRAGPAVEGCCLLGYGVWTLTKDSGKPLESLLSFFFFFFYWRVLIRGMRDQICVLQRSLWLQCGQRSGRGRAHSRCFTNVRFFSGAPFPLGFYGVLGMTLLFRLRDREGGEI